MVLSILLSNFSRFSSSRTVSHFVNMSITSGLDKVEVILSSIASDTSLAVTDVLWNKSGRDVWHFRGRGSRSVHEPHVSRAIMHSLHEVTQLTEYIVCLSFQNLAPMRNLVRTRLIHFVLSNIKPV
jgi:hypothetical protein